MIYVDGATGSIELIEPLRKLGLPVEKAKLRSGDVWWVGRGEQGAPLRIGIEFKKIGELVQSLATERLQGHQLLQMHQQGPGDGKGGYDRCYLIIEGDYSHDVQGRGTMFRNKRQTPVRGMTNAVEFEKRLINLQTRGGLLSKETGTRRDTLRVIQAWYRYWTDKDLDKHKSHLAIYAPDLDTKVKEPVSDFRAWMAGLPGMSYTRSEAVASYFDDDAEAMMTASVAEWAEIMTRDEKTGKARRLGLSTAQKVWEFLHPGRTHG